MIFSLNANKDMIESKEMRDVLTIGVRRKISKLYF
jgi:hypothetical protein